MFERGKLYKHTNNTDVAFMYQGKSGEYEDSSSIVVDWWNIVHKPFVIPRAMYKVINIKHKDRENWKVWNEGDQRTG